MFRGIALGGGGVRAGLHVGALSALEAWQGHLQFPAGVWGCSAGAVLATAVAFNLTSSQIQDMYFKWMSLSDVLPPPKLSALADLTTTKGLFSMDLYEQTIVKAFQAQGIDLTSKTIADAPQPLSIVASNLTTHNPTVFTKQVRILDAIRCSSCLPLVFQPQVLYNNVYLDGGVFVDCLDSLVPPECLVLHISDPGERIYPSDIASLPLPTYLHRVYRSMRGRPSGDNVLWLRNSTIGLLDELGPQEKTHLYEQGSLQTRAFLAKRFPEEAQNRLRGSLARKVSEDGTGL